MNDGIVVTALDARTNFGKFLRRVEDEGRSVVIEKRGRPRAVAQRSGLRAAGGTPNRRFFGSSEWNRKQAHESTE